MLKAIMLVSKVRLSSRIIVRRFRILCLMNSEDRIPDKSNGTEAQSRTSKERNTDASVSDVKSNRIVFGRKSRRLSPMDRLHSMLPPEFKTSKIEDSDSSSTATTDASHDGKFGNSDELQETSRMKFVASEAQNEQGVGTEIQNIDTFAKEKGTEATDSIPELHDSSSTSTPNQSFHSKQRQRTVLPSRRLFRLIPKDYWESIDDKEADDITQAVGDDHTKKEKD